MNSLKRGSSLIVLVLFLVPFVANAQADYSISSDDSPISALSLDITMNTSSGSSPNNVDTSGDLSEMPIINPESNAAIKIYLPPKDLIYNMPVIGKQDTSLLKFGFLQLLKDMSGDKNKPSN